MTWRILVLLVIIYNPTFGQKDIYSITESVGQLTTRYSTSDSFDNLLRHMCNISEKDGPRSVMISELTNKTKIDSILLLVENSSSGETYSYYAVALVTNSRGQAYSYTFQYYSGTEKSTLTKIKKKSTLRYFNIDVSKDEYDTLEKVMYPSDLIIVSCRDSRGTWNYRLSGHPTKMIEDFIMKMR